jgi:hypothetical protein
VQQRLRFHAMGFAARAIAGFRQASAKRRNMIRLVRLIDRGSASRSQRRQGGAERDGIGGAEHSCRYPLMPSKAKQFDRRSVELAALLQRRDHFKIAGAERA